MAYLNRFATEELYEDWMLENNNIDSVCYVLETDTIHINNISSK